MLMSYLQLPLLFLVMRLTVEFKTTIDHYQKSTALNIISLCLFQNVSLSKHSPELKGTTRKDSLKCLTNKYQTDEA